MSKNSSLEINVEFTPNAHVSSGEFLIYFHNLAGVGTFGRSV